MTSEDQLLRNRGFEPCPSVIAARCERWFGVCVSLALVSLCFVSATVRVWIPSIVFAYETHLSLGLRWCLFAGGLIGLATGVLCLVSFVRACTAHPGRVWYRVVDRMSPPAQDTMEPPAALVPSGSIIDIDVVPQPATVRATTFQEADPERFRREAGAYYGTPAMRHCTHCDRPKPPTVHHCRRCGTCVDRMDHHCPWIGQCVGRGNHKYFTLFLFYTAFAGFVITATSMPNFVRFCTAAFQTPEGNSNPPSAVPPPPAPSTADGSSPAPTVTGDTSGNAKFDDVDFLMVVVFFIATLFALMLVCFFGSVWDSAVDGSTQLDHARPYDAMRSVEDNALQYERARSSREYLKRWSMGRGTSLLWFIPTTPEFDEDSIARV